MIRTRTTFASLVAGVLACAATSALALSQTYTVKNNTGEDAYDLHFIVGDGTTTFLPEEQQSADPFDTVTVTNGNSQLNFSEGFVVSDGQTISITVEFTGDVPGLTGSNYAIWTDADHNEIQTADVEPVPLPASALLLGTAFAAGLVRRRGNQS